jgi:hypothetical protein
MNMNSDLSGLHFIAFGLSFGSDAFSPPRRVVDSVGVVAGKVKGSDHFLVRSADEMRVVHIESMTDWKFFSTEDERDRALAKHRELESVGFLAYTAREITQ